MFREYLHTLKKAGNYTWAEIANVSGIPESTIRKIFSGETPDPRFDTVTKIIVSMGGNLDDAIDNKRKKDIEISSQISLKETYDMLLEEKDKRLEEKEKHNAALTKDKKILAITVVSLIASFIIFLIRSSKSPRYFAPATIDVRSTEIIFFPFI